MPLLLATADAPALPGSSVSCHFPRSASATRGGEGSFLDHLEGEGRRNGRHRYTTLKKIDSVGIVFHPRRALSSFGPHTHHEPVGRCVATIDFRIACVWSQGRTCDHRGRQWGHRRATSCSRGISAADRGAG